MATKKKILGGGLLVPVAQTVKERNAEMAARVESVPPVQANSATPLVNVADFHNAEGQTFGRGNILKLEIGQAAGPFAYKGTREIDTELGKTDAHVGTDMRGTDWGLPLAASFVSQVEDGGLKAGDQFLVLREADVKKRKGKGKGNPMSIYRIKVTARAKK